MTSENAYNFLIGRENNKLTVAKLFSTDGTASGTNLLNEQGESIHPDIKYFISSQGIEIDPTPGKINFDYLYNFSSTPSCTVTQNSFVASSHDLTFLPEELSLLYNPSVISKDIVFNTPGPGNPYVELIPRSERIIDYSIPDSGSVVEDDDLDDYNTNCGKIAKKTKCVSRFVINFPNSKINRELLGQLCDRFNFVVALVKEVEVTCEECSQVTPYESCFKTDESKKYKSLSDIIEDLPEPNNDYEFYDWGAVYEKVEMVSSCEASKTIKSINFSWVNIEGPKGKIKAKVISAGEIGPDTPAEDRGLGEALAVAGASLATTPLTGGLPIDPVGKIYEFVNPLDTLQDVADDIAVELQKIKEECSTKQNCAVCIDSSIRSVLGNKNNNSTLKKKFNQLIQRTKIWPCC